MEVGAGNGDVEDCANAAFANVLLELEEDGG